MNWVGPTPGNLLIRSGDKPGKPMGETMITDRMYRATRPNLPGLLAACALLGGAAVVSSPVFAFKDVGPASASCDTHAKGSAAWMACVGGTPAPAAAAQARSDAELFYAGYWLARSGRYEEALSFLRQAKVADEKVLTYIGFATRKLGRTDEALGYYERALNLNPGYSVARAYMGEGFLAKGEADKARAQLSEIGRRSGTASAEYAELAEHISRFEQGLPPKG